MYIWFKFYISLLPLNTFVINSHIDTPHLCCSHTPAANTSTLWIYFILAFHCFALPEPPLKLTSILNYAKTPFPLTRGWLKSIEGNADTGGDSAVPKRKRGRKLKNKQKFIKGQKRLKRNIDLEMVNSGSKQDKERRYICSICQKKQYKYRRNKLRHEKYECITGPQFSCDKCGKKYSQKKTLTSHVALKHQN